MMKSFLMKPYPNRNLSREPRIFDYRLSRTRPVVENSFGVLANQYRMFLSPLSLGQENVEKVVFSNCVLHDSLSTKCPSRHTPSGSFHKKPLETGEIKRGKWRSGGSFRSLTA